MPIDSTGNVYVDLVPPETPVAGALDIGRTVDKLAAATPEARQKFFRQAKQKMDPATYVQAVTALTKVAQGRQATTAGAMRVGPHGVPEAASTRSYGGPARPDDPAYQAVLQQSGVQHPSRRYG